MLLTSAKRLLNTAINRVLRHFNYQLRRIQTEFDLRLTFEHLLAHQYLQAADFFFVQIGAHDGVSFDGLHEFVTTHHCRGVVVEPVQDYFTELKKNYSAFPEITPVNLGIHASSKSFEIFRVDPNREQEFPSWVRGSASMLKSHLQQYEFLDGSVITEKIRCVTFGELIEQNKIKQIDLLQIDVEGYDFEILRMIDFSLISPKMIKYEHRMLSFQDQQSARDLLCGNGYSLWNDGEDTVAVLRDGETKSP